MTDITTAVMLGYIPPLQSAIRTGGDGGRVTFEVPETEIAQFAKLIAMRGERLKITVEVYGNVTERNDEAKKEPKRSGDKMGHRRIRDRRNK